MRHEHHSSKGGWLAGGRDCRLAGWLAGWLADRCVRLISEYQQQVDLWRCSRRRAKVLRRIFVFHPFATPHSPVRLPSLPNNTNTITVDIPRPAPNSPALCGSPSSTYHAHVPF